MWHITSQKSGMSALGLQRVLGLGSYETAWTCLHKLRRAMVRPDRDLLSGAIEVDEIVVGGHVRGKGPHMVGNKGWVGVAVEVRGKGSGRVRMALMPDVATHDLVAFVQRVAAPGSKIITDGRGGYSEVIRFGYSHYSLPFYGRPREELDKLFPRVHRVSTLLKRWILGIHHGRVSRKHLASYLDEYTFRFNRRRSIDRGMLFWRLAQQAVAVKPQTNKRLA